jgi:hypothetical protein
LEAPALRRTSQQTLALPSDKISPPGFDFGCDTAPLWMSLRIVFGMARVVRFSAPG